MTQSRTHSALESLCNVLSGLLIANLTWLFVIAPLYGFTNPQHEVLAINLIFTVVSFIRGYLWRRLFNWLHVRERRELTPYELETAKQIATGLGVPYQKVAEDYGASAYTSAMRQIQDAINAVEPPGGFVRVLWGYVDCDGRWFPNPALVMTADEQWAENVENGLTTRIHRGDRTQ